MLNCDQLTELVIKRALYDLQLLSDDAVELMIFTCANESLGGSYLHQVNGPALGIYQMEPATYNDIWHNYIQHKSSILIQLIHNFQAPTMPNEDRLIYDLRFATAMARLHYARVSEPIPNAKDIKGIFEYYKKYYNTSAGKANWLNALNNYSHFRNISYTFASPNCS